ncbi:MAG: hypothetical protein ACYDHX_17510 [Methanothrix sp.]
MREGQFFARALGPRRWSRFSTKAIRGDSRRPPGWPVAAVFRAGILAQFECYSSTMECSLVNNRR